MTALGVLAVGLAGTIVFLAAIGVCYRFVDAPGNGSRTAAWIMIGMMIYVIFVQGLVAPVTWLLLSEIFPQQVKSRGMGYANVAMNLTNFGLSLVFPTLLARLGGTGTYLLFALINVLRPGLRVDHSDRDQGQKPGPDRAGGSGPGVKRGRYRISVRPR